VGHCVGHGRSRVVRLVRGGLPLVICTPTSTHSLQDGVGAESTDQSDSSDVELGLGGREGLGLARPGRVAGVANRERFDHVSRATYPGEEPGGGG
jgi:hypothetical protein